MEPTGATSWPAPASSITLGDAVEALEGPPALTSCEGLGALERSGVCEVASVCPIRDPLQRVRTGIWDLMQGISLRALADRSLEPADLFDSARGN